MELRSGDSEPTFRRAPDRRCGSDRREVFRGGRRETESGSEPLVGADESAPGPSQQPVEQCERQQSADRETGTDRQERDLSHHNVSPSG